MYLPRHFDEDDPGLLVEVMRKHNFATLVSTVDGEHFASHVPVMSRYVEGALEISGHLARANPQWRGLESLPSALVIFQGPHTYISPTLYAGTNRVPTWNYVAVHASGHAVVNQDDDHKLSMLQHLISQHEPGYRAQFAALEPAVLAGLTNAIVGFTVYVTRLQGKFKLGQHRLAEDGAAMQAMHDAGNDDQRAIAAWMRQLGYWT